MLRLKVASMDKANKAQLPGNLLGWQAPDVSPRTFSNDLCNPYRPPKPEPYEVIP